MPEITFRMAAHTRRPGVYAVEILHDGAVCAVMYPMPAARDAEPGVGGVRIVSAHLLNRPDGVYFSLDEATIPAVTVMFKPGEYSIVGGKIVKTGDAK